MFFVKNVIKSKNKILEKFISRGEGGLLLGMGVSKVSSNDPKTKVNNCHM